MPDYGGARGFQDGGRRGGGKSETDADKRKEERAEQNIKNAISAGPKTVRDTLGLIGKKDAEVIGAADRAAYGKAVARLSDPEKIKLTEALTENVVPGEDILISLGITATSQNIDFINELTDKAFNEYNRLSEKFTAAENIKNFSNFVEQKSSNENISYENLSYGDEPTIPLANRYNTIKHSSIENGTVNFKDQGLKARMNQYALNEAINQGYYEAASKYGFEHEKQLRKLAKDESGGNLNAVGDGGNSIGLFQLDKNVFHEGTEGKIGFGIEKGNVYDPVENLRMASDYFHALTTKYNGDPRKATMAYVAGMHTVDRAVTHAGKATTVDAALREIMQQNASPNNIARAQADQNWQNIMGRVRPDEAKRIEWGGGDPIEESVYENIRTQEYGKTLTELGEQFDRGTIKTDTTDQSKSEPFGLNTVAQKIFKTGKEVAKLPVTGAAGYIKDLHDYYASIGLEGFFGPPTPEVIKSQRQSMTQPGEMGRADDINALQQRMTQPAGGIAGGGTYPGLLGGYTDQTSPALRFFAQTSPTGTGTQTGGRPIFSRYAQARQAVNFSLAPFSQTASQNVFTPFLQTTNLNTGIL